jgi:hypothetical protein
MHFRYFTGASDAETQTTRSGQQLLEAGMVLMLLNGKDMRGVAYEDILEAITVRPLELNFRALSIDDNSVQLRPARVAIPSGAIELLYPPLQGDGMSKYNDIGVQVKLPCL